MVHVPRPVDVSLRVDAKLMRRSQFRPGVTLTIAFAALILLGTGLLMLPFALAEGRQADFLVAFFTATSAKSSLSAPNSSKYLLARTAKLPGAVRPFEYIG